MCIRDRENPHRYRTNRLVGRMRPSTRIPVDDAFRPRDAIVRVSRAKARWPRRTGDPHRARKFLSGSDICSFADRLAMMKRKTRCASWIASEASGEASRRMAPERPVSRRSFQPRASIHAREPAGCSGTPRRRSPPAAGSYRACRGCRSPRNAVGEAKAVMTPVPALL